MQQKTSRSRLFRRLKSGPHGQLVELYAARLVEDGLVRHGTWRCLNLVDGLLSWIASGRWELADLDERMVERYLRHRTGNQSVQPGDPAALKRLLSVMREACQSARGRGIADRSARRPPHSFRVTGLTWIVERTFAWLGGQQAAR